MKIIRNSARCLKCGDHLISHHRHDFKGCSCGSLFVDGGLDYIKRVGDPLNIEETSQYIDEKDTDDE